MTRTLVWIAASLGMMSAALAAPSGGAPPPMAASLSGSSEPAAVARDQVIKDALEKLKAAEASGGSATYARPWQDMSWLGSGSGKVGRLFDLCTGAVEPAPMFAGWAGAWETSDPRKLSPAERSQLVEWQVQQIIAQYGCGSVFVIGSLSSDARRKLRVCPTRPDNGVGDVNAFIRHVHRRPALRSNDDLTGTLVEALRAEGCS